LATCSLAAPTCLAQSSSAGEGIPIERCDVLPVVVVKVAGKDMRFLLDTAATSILNVKSFSAGVPKEIHISSWTGSAATSAREVSIPEMLLGKHKLQNLKLPAIDLSPIGKACDGRIDGILGVDLLDKMGVTIDLKRRIAMLDTSPPNPHLQFDEMEKAMEHCNTAFNLGNAEELADCFDPEIVLYTPHGEFRGRPQVMQYLQSTYLRFAPKLHYDSRMRDVQAFGDALWYSYDYSIEVPGQLVAGHGMAMCRRQNGQWRVLNMHNSLRDPEAEAAPKP
jgi:ketosteroid isomerase-like protein